MRKKQLIFISFILLLSVVAFASCSEDQGEAKAPALVSESVDTPVTITGYTDFGQGAQYFLKEGDRKGNRSTKHNGIGRCISTKGEK